MLLAAHVLCIVVGLAINPLLASVASASTVLLLFGWIVRARGLLLSFAPALAFSFFSTLTFAYMNLAYVELTSLPTADRHDLLAWLTALLVGTVALGAAGMHSLLGPDAFPTQVTPLVRSRPALLVTGAFFAAFVALHLATGFLDARWSDAQGGDFGPRYLVQGIGWFGFVFFFVLGTRLEANLLSIRNLTILGLVTVLALLQGLSGGRGLSLFMVVLTLAGGAWSNLSGKQVRMLALIALLVGAPFAVVIGGARTQQGFARGSIEDRAQVIGDQASSMGAAQPEGERPLDVLLSRLFEISAVVVIAQTARMQTFAGFEHFDRLKYLFVPKALAPDKLPVNDGKEILMRDFGYQLGENTGVPICVVADAFRRGGETWVAVVGFLTGMILRLLSRLTLLVVGRDFAVVALAFLLLSGTSMHGESVLGLISVLSYQWLKLVVLCVALVSAIRLVTWMTGDARRGMLLAPPMRPGPQPASEPGRIGSSGPAPRR